MKIKFTKKAQMTSDCTSILSDIGKIFPERIWASNTRVGPVAWFRHSDGQIYEIQVSPADIGPHSSLLAEHLGVKLTGKSLGDYLRKEYNVSPTEKE